MDFTPEAFRAALLAVPTLERDAWVDRQLGLTELPDDGPSLPREGVPYLPSPVHALVRLVELANIGPDDVVVDVGSGVGRASVVLHALTGATVIGLEVQPQLVAVHRELIARHRLERVSVLEGDATLLLAEQRTATVFTLYCPFSGAMLDRALGSLEPLGRARALRLGCIDLPLPARDWLEPAHSEGEVTVYRSCAARLERAHG